MTTVSFASSSSQFLPDSSIISPIQSSSISFKKKQSLHGYQQNMIYNVVVRPSTLPCIKQREIQTWQEKNSFTAMMPTIFCYIHGLVSRPIVIQKLVKTDPETLSRANFGKSCWIKGGRIWQREGSRASQENPLSSFGHQWEYKFNCLSSKWKGKTESRNHYRLKAKLKFEKSHIDCLVLCILTLFITISEGKEVENRRNEKVKESKTRKMKELLPTAAHAKATENECFCASWAFCQI